MDGLATPALTATADPSGFTIRLETNILANGRVGLEWTGANGSRVDIERNGTVHRSTRNDGAATDKTPTQTGSYTYRICERDTGLCSNPSTVVFGGGGPQPPTANPGGPYTGHPGVPVQFDGSASSDADGSVESYSWDFGDGSAEGTGAQPTHTYATPATYTVTLTVTDDEGLASTPVQATVNIIDPSGSPITLTARILANQRVRLDWSGANGSRVDIVRNEVKIRSTTNDGATTDNPASRTGTHTYRICEQDTDLCSNAASVSYGGNQAPTADPAGPYAGEVGEPVQFDGSGSSDPEGPVQTYQWDFGDGSPTATGAQPTHAYSAAGSYTVTLTVTDQEDLASQPATTTATINGAGNLPPVADAGGPYQTTDGWITVDGSGSDDPDGDNADLTYAWDFGDGNSGAGVSTTHQYADPGEYTVSLTVTDAGGLEAVASVQAVYSEAANEPPVADAGGPYQTTDGTVTFDGSASDDPDGPNSGLTYAWDFGDGGSGVGVSPSHTYSQFGTYTVSLQVTDQGGLTSGAATTTAEYIDDGGSGGGGVRTSTQPGSWDSPSTWGGESPPGDGDQAVVRHAVSLSSHTTVGQHAPGGGTVDLDVQPGGSLVVGSGASLRVKGNVQYAGRIRVEGGASFLLDAPFGQTYTVNVHSGAPLGAVLEARGSSGNPGVFDLNAGQGTGVLAPVLILGNGVLDFEHGIFRGGDAGNLNRVQIRSGQHFRLIDSRVENSAGIYQLTPVASGGRVTIENSTWVGTVTSEALRLNRWDNPSTPGTTRFVHSVFDQRAFIEGPDALIDSCYLAEGLITTAGATVYPRVVQNSLVRRTSQGFMNITGDYIDNVHLEDYTTSNPHGVQVNLNAVASTIRGNVFKYTGTSGSGDLIAPRSTNPNPVTMAVQENLVLLNGDGTAPSGTLVSLLGDELWTVSIERNTYPVQGGSGGIAVAETYSGHAGYVTTINSNLAVGLTSGSGSVVHEVHAGIVSNYITEAVQNGYHNAGTPYDVPAHAFATPPGSGDVSGDPLFVDPNRDLASYDLAHGGNGTVAHLLSEVARMNDPGFNPAFEPSAIRDWIRAGFRPQNPAFQGAGKNGVDIGAVSW